MTYGVLHFSEQSPSKLKQKENPTMKNVSHKKIWRTSAVQINVDPPLINLIKVQTMRNWKIIV